MSPKLAASISPLARAFETPSQVRVRSLTKRKGRAPTPVATAVSSARRKTCTTLETSMGVYGIARGVISPFSDLGTQVDQDRALRRVQHLGRDAAKPDALRYV